MVRSIALGIAVTLILCALGHAAPLPPTTWVTHTGDSGPGSLRDAIVEANVNSGPDIIDFDPSLAGATITPLSSLPALTDGGTTIDGRDDLPGRPKFVTINGWRTGASPGLRLYTPKGGPGCTIRGLVLRKFPGVAMHIDDSSGHTVANCFFGTTNTGLSLRPNGSECICITDSEDCTIGGPLGTHWNIFASEPDDYGIVIEDSTRITVQGGRFGIKLVPTSQFPSAKGGVGLYRSTHCTIGGQVGVTGNAFTGADAIGVYMQGIACTGNAITGNYFGVGLDGDANFDLGCGVWLAGIYNNVGGPTPGERNIFAGNAVVGVRCTSTGARGNKIRGNYFGTNADGTLKRPLALGILVGSGALGQTIGGVSAAAGNYFCCTKGSTPLGICLLDGGGTVRIENNTFGIRPGGQSADGMVAGVLCNGADATLRGNRFARLSGYGVRCDGATKPGIFGNRFERCGKAVQTAGSASCILGDLGNASVKDDGGNEFKASNTWFVHNRTANRIKAEGNEFPSPLRAAINARIYDNKDNPAYGPVDFDPLAGGVSPADAGVVGVSGLVAAPTARGAEIAFSLSSPASVTVAVMNLAGRPVATVAANAPMDGGVQRLIWSGRSSAGVPVPTGRYLVRVQASGDGGMDAHALIGLSLRAP